MPLYVFLMEWLPTSDDDGVRQQLATAVVRHVHPFSADQKAQAQRDVCHDRQLVGRRFPRAARHLTAQDSMPMG